MAGGLQVSLTIQDHSLHFPKMHNLVKRRTFLLGSGMSVGLSALSACAGKKRSRNVARDDADRAQSISDQMSGDEVMTLLHLKAAQHMSSTGNCAQSTFLALSDVFGLEGKVDLRALTVLPGLAERGGTCGCVVACLMAMGLSYGSDLPGDRAAYARTLVPANRFYDHFLSDVGQSDCSTILLDKFGRKFDLKLPDDLRDYRANNGPEYCTTIVQKAVKLAATELLKNRNS